MRLDALIRFDFVEPDNEEELQLDRGVLKMDCVMRACVLF